MRLSEKILFLIEFGEEYLGELGELVDNKAEFEWILSVDRRAVRRSLGYLVKKGYLNKRGVRKIRFKVTRRGCEKLQEIRPGLKIKKWDGKWRIVMFDIEEKYRGMRTVLRKFLVNLGFRQFQRSLWITASDISREVCGFLNAARLNKMAYLMEVDLSKPGGGLEVSELADKLWGLGKLERDYQVLAIECSRSDKLVKAHKAMLEKLLFADPLLPKQLLPKGFSRGRALREYKALVDRSRNEK